MTLLLTATWIQLPEPRMSLEYLFRTMRFEHDFCLFNRVPFRNVDLEMNVNSSKTKLAELKSKPFEFAKSLGAGIDVGLFSETVVPAFGVKLHRDPVVACVMRWLFIASATYNFHIFDFSCRTITGHTLSGVLRATKGESLAG